MNTTFETLTHFADRLVRNAERDLTAWKEKLEKNPAYAFEWSSNAFQAAAELEVGKTVQAWLKMAVTSKRTEERLLKDIMDEVRGCVIRGARWPQHSSSPQSNEMKTTVISVWAELLMKHEGL